MALAAILSWGATARAQQNQPLAWLPKLPDTMAAFDTAYRAWMKQYAIKRGALSVTYQGRLIELQGYGGGDGSERVHLASLSKAITAVCAARLVDAGRLGFGTSLGELMARANGARTAAPISAHWPPQDGRIAQITIGQLISHRAGIGGKAADPATGNNLVALFKRTPPASAQADDMLDALLSARLTATPGVDYLYSNGGYVLLGAVIEAATGQPYREHCAASVLAPLGIKDAGFAENWAVMGPYGGWALSGPEYLAFYKALEPGPGSLLGPAARDWNENGADRVLPTQPSVHYGLGLNVRKRGPGVQWWHTGSWDWAQTGDMSGRLYANLGALAVHSELGASWFVHYQPQPSAQAKRELDIVLWQAARAIRIWPEGDRFAAFGLR